ncbi:MAG: DUF5317 family protein [Candidatus Dormibacterales bacterium]
MVFVLGAAIGLAAGLLAKGSLTNLASVRFRWPLFVVAALLLKELGVLSPLSHAGLTPYLYSAGMLGLVAWTLWHLDRLPGVWLVTAGLIANLAVVLSNGAHMPVDPGALRGVAPAMASALREHGTLGQYALAGPGTHLAWLDDRIPGPFGAAYSVGDVLTFAGVAVLAFMLTRRPHVRAQPASRPDRIAG